MTRNWPSGQHDEIRALTAGDLELDIGAHQVTVNGRPVDLTPQEFRLLQALLEGADHVMTTKELLAAAWGPDHAVVPNALPVYILRLRTKLERQSGALEHIRTVRGLGYILDTAPTQESAARTPASD